MGDFGAIKAAQPGEQHAEWIKQLGSVFRYRHMFGTPRIFISDPKAMLVSVRCGVVRPRAKCRSGRAPWLCG
jgi:hypothetical protein